MRDLLAMTARARARRVVVRRVAGGAQRVRRRREDRFRRVARRALRDLGDAELVWLMTDGALAVADGERLHADAERPWLARMTLRALVIRRALRLVSLVAVEAAARARVTRLLVRVTRRACRWIERRRLMRVMTVAARLIGVRADGVLRALRTIVTTHARSRRRGSESMTVLAGRRVRVRMEWRRDLRVTRRAQTCGGSSKRVAVTCGARDLADVRGVTRAGANGEICERHFLGNRQVTAGAAQRDNGDDECADHGCEPIG